MQNKFSRHSHIRTGHPGKGSEVRKPRLVGVEHGDKRPRRIKFIFCDGRTMSIPYAFLPTITLTPMEDVRLITNEFIVIIRGRSLDRLETWLSEERVSWIEESPSAVDDGQMDVFIASIIVKGEIQM